MIQIAESQMKCSGNLFKIWIQRRAPNGNKSLINLKDKLKYNPMEGIIVVIVVWDDRLTIVHDGHRRGIPGGILLPHIRNA